ncbi:MAG: GC-type dockerin domain-anchored protein [Phycisphaerales bacterium]|nr:GC-type dockerin domain-anchored protein [Phycisphaerales bacterium]
MNTEKRSNGSSRRVVLSACVCGLVAGAAAGGWPDDAGTPLVVGVMENAFGERQSSVVTDDGAVWYAWQDSLCVGSVRAQRVGFDGSLLSVDGVVVQDDPTCAFHVPPALLAIGDGVVATRALSSVRDFPLQMYSDDGSPQWGTGFAVESADTLGALGKLTSGDVLVVRRGFGEIYADRLSITGEPVWDERSVIVDGVSANMRILGAIPISDGGAYVFWDSHIAYTKLVYAVRVNADGSTAWDSFTHMVSHAADVESSRHSDPVVVSDGSDGAVLVFAKGFETGTTPAPLLLQRVDPEGKLVFPIDGVRVSLGSARQFYPNVQTDPATGDLFIVWMDGQMGNSTVRAQRMTADGVRLWGNEGIEVSGFDSTFGSFDAVWLGNQISVVVGGNGLVEMHRFDVMGNVATDPVEVGTTGITEYVRAEASGDGVVVSWQADQSIVAQRVNPDGRIGNAACSTGDLVSPFGSLNFLDVSAFLSAFAAQDFAVDFESDGSLNFLDVSAFLSIFSAGCP